jgi:ABC-type tungstate transport system permease subunit
VFKKALSTLTKQKRNLNWKQKETIKIIIIQETQMFNHYSKIVLDQRTTQFNSLLLNQIQMQIVFSAIERRGTYNNS